MEVKRIHEVKYNQTEVKWIQAKHFKSNGSETDSRKQVQSNRSEMDLKKAF